MLTDSALTAILGTSAAGDDDDASFESSEAMMCLRGLEHAGQIFWSKFDQRERPGPKTMLRRFILLCIASACTAFSTPMGLAKAPGISWDLPKGFMGRRNNHLARVAGAATTATTRGWRPVQTSDSSTSRRGARMMCSADSGDILVLVSQPVFRNHGLVWRPCQWSSRDGERSELEAAAPPSPSPPSPPHLLAKYSAWSFQSRRPKSEPITLI